MTELLQQLLNGVAVGAVYALFAMGFGVIFSTMGILNLAQGVYATWGAVAAFELADHLHAGFWLSAVGGLVAGGLLAVIVDQVAFQPLRGRGRNLLGAVITSVGAWLALEDVAQIATNSAPLQLPAWANPSGTIHLGPVELITYQLDEIVVAAVLAVAVWLLLQRTKIGSAIRAVGYDAVAASLSGVNARRILISTAFLSGALTALAGVFEGISTNISYSLGDGLLIAGFASVVIGGVGDVRGAAIGGLLIGIVETLSAQYISNNFQDAITFGLLFLFLVAWPRGLFGASDVVRA